MCVRAWCACVVSALFVYCAGMRGSECNLCMYTIANLCAKVRYLYQFEDISDPIEKRFPKNRYITLRDLSLSTFPQGELFWNLLGNTIVLVISVIQWTAIKRDRGAKPLPFDRSNTWYGFNYFACTCARECACARGCVLRARVRVCMYVCLVIISPYLLRHWIVCVYVNE